MSFDAGNDRRRRRVIASITKRPWMVGLGLSLGAAAIGVAVSLANWPAPRVHDEFSYLLAADTFCEGRLTNPTHRHWPHFETIHVIQQPTYASKYPPGQGLFLALGQWATGEPLAGVWLLTGLSTGACYWMLLGWVPRRWAAVGGLIAAVQPGSQLWWGQNYWGGGLALLGGALVVGAVPRVVRRCRVMDAVAMGVGSGALALSRPYEGLVFCSLSGAMVLLGWRRRGYPPWGALFGKVAVPLIIVLATWGVWLGHYHRAVTGSPWKLPYSVHEAAYGQCPLFLWQTPKTVDYRHASLVKFHEGWSMDWYRRQRTVWGVLKEKVNANSIALPVLAPPILAVSLLFLRPLKSRRQLAVLGLVGLSWLASMVTIWSYPHYMAPMAGALLLLVVWGLRSMRGWGGASSIQRGLAPALIAVYVVVSAIQIVKHCFVPHEGLQWRRQAIAEQLATMPGKHLVFVRYNSNHHPLFEWVYNLADIDAAQTVWAREMSPAENRALAEYFRGRKTWLLEADAPAPTLATYRVDESPCAVKSAPPRRRDDAG
jgi:hypothetical protein